MHFACERGEFLALPALSRDAADAPPLSPPWCSACVAATAKGDAIVVLAEGSEPGIEFGIVPIGLQHGGLEIVEQQPKRDASARRRFSRRAEIVRGLTKDEASPVALAGMAQNDAEGHMRAPAAPSAGCSQAPGAKIDLGFFPCQYSNRQSLSSHWVADSPLKRRTRCIVGAGETVLADEVPGRSAAADNAVRKLATMTSRNASAIAAARFAQRWWRAGTSPAAAEHG